MRALSVAGRLLLLLLLLLLLRRDGRFRFGDAESGRTATAGHGDHRTDDGGPTAATAEPEAVQVPVDNTVRVHGVLDGQRGALDSVQHHIQHHRQVLRRVQLRHRHHVHHIHDRVRAAGHTGVVGSRPTG